MLKGVCGHPVSGAEHLELRRLTAGLAGVGREVQPQVTRTGRREGDRHRAPGNTVTINFGATTARYVRLNFTVNTGRPVTGRLSLRWRRWKGTSRSPGHSHREVLWSWEPIVGEGLLAGVCGVNDPTERLKPGPTELLDGRR